MLYFYVTEDQNKWLTRFRYENTELSQILIDLSLPLLHICRREIQHRSSTLQSTFRLVFMKQDY